MDAGLAKVINSTVGTDLFRPLDKVLYSRQGLVPSENAYFKIGNFEEQEVVLSLSDKNTETKTAYGETMLAMKMWTDGGFSLGTSIEYGIKTSGAWGMSISGGIIIFRNGVNVAVVSASRADQQLINTFKADIKSEDVYFSAGDFIEIKPYISGRKYDNNASYTVDLLCKVKPSDPIIVYADSVEKPFDITYAE